RRTVRLSRSADGAGAAAVAAAGAHVRAAFAHRRTSDRGPGIRDRGTHVRTEQDGPHDGELLPAGTARAAERLVGTLLPPRGGARWRGTGAAGGSARRNADSAFRLRLAGHGKRRARSGRTRGGIRSIL